MPLRLNWRREDGTLGRVVLDGELAITLGRGTDATIHLWKRTVTAPLHARIRRDMGGWVIEDLGSTNGTYVNSGEHRRRAPAVLRVGDIIEIAGHGLTVDSSDAGDAPSATLQAQPAPVVSEAKLRVLRALARRPDGTRPTVGEAAAALQLSPDTVKQHVIELCDLLGVEGGAGRLDRLVRAAEELGVS